VVFASAYFQFSPQHPSATFYSACVSCLIDSISDMLLLNTCAITLLVSSLVSIQQQSVLASRLALTHVIMHSSSWRTFNRLATWTHQSVPGTHAVSNYAFSFVLTVTRKTGNPRDRQKTCFDSNLSLPAPACHRHIPSFKDGSTLTRPYWYKQVTAMARIRNFMTVVCGDT
jgi:hypothetical protein